MERVTMLALESGHTPFEEDANRRLVSEALHQFVRDVTTAGATGETVAVNVTFCPNADGLIDEPSVVVEAPALTVWVSAGEVLGLKSPVPS